MTFLISGVTGGCYKLIISMVVTNFVIKAYLPKAWICWIFIWKVQVDFFFAMQKAGQVIIMLQ